MKNQIIKLSVILIIFLTSCQTIPKFWILGEPGLVLWPNGEIYYEFSKEVPEYCKERVIKAMEEWDEKTNIKFIQREDEFSYVEIMWGFEYAAHVGMRGGRQHIILMYFCDYSAVLHELGHAVGLNHEHQRADRDKYVEIVWDNIEEGMGHNFTKLREDSQPVITPYDFKSIMHYGSYAFSNNHKKTIIKKECPACIIPQGSKITTWDIEKVNYLYP